ncbi:hypothetical protein RUM44_009675 [Polyplax serrata]|uniref:Peptidase S1 domain-containing protein n=1 Tax=Polyplax serrata TaxID=468196 RepID=A0ABR1ATM0_POLSC
MGSILDSQTVITAEQVLRVPTRTPENILALAGSLSPWWGKNSQVRHIKEIMYHEYEVVLLTVKNDWKFNKFVAPIKLPKKFYRTHTPVYGKHAIVFGIVLDYNLYWGDAVPKGKTYFASLNRAVHEVWEECEATFPKLKAKFNVSTHYCLYPNDTFGHGCLGSPSVGVNRKGNINLVGVIIGTTSTGYDLVIKISYLDKWIKTRSLLGSQMILH